MSINLRQDAPSQSDIINPEELAVEIEKLQTIYKNIEHKEKEMKELKEDEKVQSGIIIPQIMERMNLSTLKLKDGSEISVKAPGSKAGKNSTGIGAVSLELLKSRQYSDVTSQRYHLVSFNVDVLV